MAINPVDLASQSFILAAPLLLAATAGYLSERSGIVNIALEGKMLGACAALAIAAPSLGAGPALGVAILVAVVLSLLHFVATQLYSIDGIISGMVVNLLALGGSGYAYDALGGGGGLFTGLPKPLYYGLAVALPIVTHLYVGATRGGLRLVAVGADPDKARLVGISPLRVRFFALVGCGVLCGLAGALLVTEVSNFSQGMTAGRGFIALAALILGGWRPIPTLFACLAFGLAYALQIQLQGQGGIPTEVWSMLPYVATLIALSAASRRRRPPAGLGKL